MSPIGRLDYRCIRRRSATVALKLRRWKRQIVDMIGRETNEPPHFRVPDPGHCALPLGTRRGTKKKEETQTRNRRVENDGRNVDGSSAEEILNILFIERQAKLTQAPGVVVVVDRHGSSQCVPRQTWTRNGRGIGGVHRWNSTPTGRASDVGGKQSTCSNGGRGTPSHSYSCLWKLVHLPRSLLETIWHKAWNVQPPPPRFYPRLENQRDISFGGGKEAYEGWMVLGRICAFVSSSLGDNIVPFFTWGISCSSVAWFPRGWLVQCVFYPMLLFARPSAWIACLEDACRWFGGW